LSVQNITSTHSLHCSRKECQKRLFGQTVRQTGHARFTHHGHRHAVQLPQVAQLGKNRVKVAILLTVRSSDLTRFELTKYAESAAALMMDGIADRRNKTPLVKRKKRVKKHIPMIQPFSFRTFFENVAIFLPNLAFRNKIFAQYSTTGHSEHSAKSYPFRICNKN